MKTIDCPDCGGAFTAASREDILGILYDHYMTEHRDLITQASREQKRAWMEDFERRWSAAKETEA